MFDFDPGRAKRLEPGEFISFPPALGPRSEASRTTRYWFYRCRSRIDGELSQGERKRVLTAGEVRDVLRFLPTYTPIIADALEFTLRTAATLLGDLGCPFEIIEAILAHRLPSSKTSSTTG
jgi:hypothetical protein